MIKAIETHYRGYRFRSRLEARWAVFFDALGVTWEYEKEGYDLGDAGWYLPDFWLPNISMDGKRSGIWIEIKDEHLEDDPPSRNKAHLLGMSGHAIVVFYGQPGPHACGTACYGDGEHYAWLAINEHLTWFLTSNHGELNGFCWGLLESAMYRARSARFEHGERGQ